MSYQRPGETKENHLMQEKKFLYQFLIWSFKFQNSTKYITSLLLHMLLLYKNTSKSN